MGIVPEAGLFREAATVQEQEGIGWEGGGLRPMIQARPRHMQIPVVRIQSRQQGIAQGHDGRLTSSWLSECHRGRQRRGWGRD